MFTKTIAGALVGWCLLGPAFAEDATPDNEDGRYAFSKQAEGVLRLDQQTGEVSVCSQRTVGWACQAAPDDRAVLESEIARLRTENIALKKAMLAHDLPLPNGVAAEPPAAFDGDRTPHLSDNSDLDRMV